MRVIIEKNDEKVGEIAALYVMKKINEFEPQSNKYFVLGLPTGRLIFLYAKSFYHITLSL